jgi:hypothetical protein
MSPNLLIIKGGQVKEQIIGQVPKSHLTRAIDTAIAYLQSLTAPMDFSAPRIEPLQTLATLR